MMRFVTCDACMGATGSVPNNGTAIQASYTSDGVLSVSVQNRDEKSVKHIESIIPCKKSVFDVAAYIISKQNTLSISKLQLLLYYCQAWSLVWDDEAAFDAKILAGPNGPFIEEIQYSFLGDFIISDRFSLGAVDRIPINIRETCDVVLDHYGFQTAQELVFLSQTETPWREARTKGCGHTREIPLDNIVTYYRGVLSKNGEKQ